MNSKDLLLIFIFAALFSLSCCSTIGDTKSADMEVPSSTSDNTVQTAFPAEGWSYETEITNEGSRSQGSVSRLFYRYKEIEPVFNRIVIEGHIFIYQPMINLWDKSGYIHSGTEDSVFKILDNEKISREDLKRGWYITSTPSPKSGTPDTWVLVESDSLSVWVSPENLSEVIILYNLKPKDRPELYASPVTEGE